MIRCLSFLILLFLISCQNQKTLDISYLHNEALLSIRDTTYVQESNNFLGNFITKSLLQGGRMYFKDLNKNQVDAYIFEDSAFITYKYKKRPIEINDFDVSKENVFLLSSYNNKIICFNKEGDFIEEIQLKPEKYEVEQFMGETLFHYNAQKQIFYVGLKPTDNHKNGIETVGIFDSAGDLVSTFGDFSKDNSAGVRGFILSNEGMRSKFISNKLFVLKKETSNLYGFDEDGHLISTQKILFKKIPDKSKELKKGMSRGILKDQVMDFFVMDSAICYTYMTDTGDFFGQKTPVNYFAYKKDKTDTIIYSKIDFLKINAVDKNKIIALTKDKERDNYILLESKINL